MLRQDGRIKSKTVDLWLQIRSLFDTYQDVLPVTVRQAFYLMVSAFGLPKTHAEYRRVQDGIRRMRIHGIIPYEWIVDSTRWVRRPATYSNMRHMLEVTRDAYRRSLIGAQTEQVEIWIEKDALAGVFFPITSTYDVPLYVARGQSSDTFCYESAMQLKNATKPVFVYYFSDFDKSGKSAAVTVRNKLRKHGAKFTFVDAALTEQQITDWNIPTRPPKKHDDRKFAAELEAIPPNILRQLIDDTIKQHIDPYTMYQIELAETLERESFNKIIETAHLWGDNGSVQ